MLDPDETPIAVSAEEPKYESDPANVAVIVYAPCDEGVQIVLNIPFTSLMTVPMSVGLPLASVAVSFMGTPCALVGFCFCS